MNPISQALSAAVLTLALGASGVQAQAPGRPAEADPSRYYDQAEHIYGAETLSLSNTAAQASHEALRKSRHPAVRAFAEAEIAEERTLSPILSELATNQRSRPLPLLIAPAPPELYQHQALQQTPAGPTFDRDYVRLQIALHERLARLQQGYLRSGRHTHMRRVAMLSGGQIHDHLKTLRRLAEQVERAAPR
jgi:predicted outer membrane protein